MPSHNPHLYVHPRTYNNTEVQDASTQYKHSPPPQLAPPHLHSRQGARVPETNSAKHSHSHRHPHPHSHPHTCIHAEVPGCQHRYGQLPAGVHFLALKHNTVPHAATFFATAAVTVAAAAVAANRSLTTTAGAPARNAPAATGNAITAAAAATANRRPLCTTPNKSSLLSPADFIAALITATAAAAAAAAAAAGQGVVAF